MRRERLNSGNQVVRRPRKNKRTKLQRQSTLIRTEVDSLPTFWPVFIVIISVAQVCSLPLSALLPPLSTLLIPLPPSLPFPLLPPSPLHPPYSPPHTPSPPFLPSLFPPPSPPLSSLLPPLSPSSPPSLPMRLALLPPRLLA